MQPAVGVEGLRAALGVVQVAGRDDGTPGEHLAVRCDAHLDPGQRPADRARLSRIYAATDAVGRAAATDDPTALRDRLLAVNGDALTGANADDLAHNKLINVNLLFASVFCNNTCGVRCKPDELCNGIARAGFCTLFEVFAQHDESDDNAGGFEIQPFMHHMVLSFEYQYG